MLFFKLYIFKMKGENFDALTTANFVLFARKLRCYC